MKTVQEYLKELDENRLIEVYLQEHPIEYGDCIDKDMTVAEIAGMVKRELRQYIERLREMPVDHTDPGKNVLFAHRALRDGIDQETIELICLDEFLAQGYKASSYSYVYSPQSEILGYYVADTDYTRCCIYELIADVLSEASIFGFRQEHLAEERQKLMSAMEDAKAGRCISWEETKKELLLDDLRDKKETEEEKELRDRAVRAALDYCDCSRRNELDKLKELLQSNKGDAFQASHGSSHI